MLNLILLFIGIELSAFSSYALVSFRKKDDLSTEAGTKYVLIGAFSSAMMLYGISLIYAITGNLNLEEINEILNSSKGTDFSTHIFISILFIVTGLGFKISAVPFHSWAPDVYQGAMTLRGQMDDSGFSVLPSTAITWPLTRRAASLARKTAIPAIS